MPAFVVGIVQAVSPVAGKDKLQALEVDIGSGGDPLTIVTNASNVRVDSRVVVATVGCELRDGTTVKKAAVGGVSSEGMLCDAPMLGWVGGGAGAAALVPETFSAGDAPPAERPRMGGPAAAAPAAPAVEVKPLFEKKLTKEEKKAAAAAKKAEREAKKAARKDAEGVEGAMAELAVSGEAEGENTS
mmetsp:Transcript_29849/g.95273  ORF Transcript_29849/g.95273 Transcript_29849/m.95273 type:complete len:187 (-) Transcript_29849:81-641(-)